MIYNTTKAQEFAELDVVTEDSKLYTITLYNDDVNTFEWVIECLTKYCGHDFIQAEQCATLVHYKGKCIVKSGSLDKLKPICEVLLEKGLSAEIN
jgi:ATP-dependent Clp protease adaptor protein ClpS